MTTDDLTMLEAEDESTSDTNFVRPSLSWDRLKSISRTRVRELREKSKVPIYYDDDNRNTIN